MVCLWRRALRRRRLEAISNANFKLNPILMKIRVPGTLSRSMQSSSVSKETSLHSILWRCVRVRFCLIVSMALSTDFRCVYPESRSLLYINPLAVSFIFTQKGNKHHTHAHTTHRNRRSDLCALWLLCHQLICIHFKLGKRKAQSEMKGECDWIIYSHTLCCVYAYAFSLMPTKAAQI